MPVRFVNDVSSAVRALVDAASPVVIIPVFNAYPDVVRCYDSIIAHTSPAVSILIVDDCGADRRFFQLIRQTGPGLVHQVVVLSHLDNCGFVGSCNDGFRATLGRDAILVNSDVVVGAEWLERLMAAALSSPLIATASTLTNHGSILSVPYRNSPAPVLPDGLLPAEAARRVARDSPRLRPSIPTAVGHCCYIRRQILDLVGYFDESFSPGYGEEVDFSQRAIALGFRHICADDVFTFHRGGASFTSAQERDLLRYDHELIVQARYPWYRDAVQRACADPFSTLAAVVDTATRSLIGPTVGVDAFCLGSGMLGTQQVVTGTVQALARHPAVSRLMVFVRSLGESSVEQLRRLLPRVEFLPFDPASDAPDELVDVVYRPYQVTDASDLEFLRRVGRRLVINQLDIIAFENPSYFGSGDQWLEYRNITRLALRLADGIAFLSGGVAQDARREGLIEGVKANSIVGCGLDLQTVDSQERRPVGLDHGDGGFLLCVGAAYHHKNRRFALSVWAELRRRGWMGRIVLAGPVPPHGNSLAQEAEFAIEHPHLRPGIVTLGRVSEAEKCWLYRRAALVLYPSTSEGFGLIPFEAARYNVPTLAPRLGGLEDFDSGTTPTLTGFDVDDAADGAWALLSDRSTADKACAAILDHAARYTWDDTATNLVGLFEETLRRPRCRDLSIAGDGMRPVGLTVPIRAPQRRVERMDALVRAVIARPALKRVVAPHGSARQRLARLVLSRLRSRLERVPR